MKTWLRAGLMATALGAVHVGLLGAQTSSDSTDRFSFDLDTQAGHFSQWSYGTLRRHSCLRARLVIGELRRSGRWVPAYGLWLASGRRSASLRIWAPEGRPPLDVLLLDFGPADTPTDTVSLGYRVNRGDTVTVDLNWATPGTLRAVVDGHAGELPLHFRPEGFVATSANGQLKADSLTFFDCQ